MSRCLMQAAWSSCAILVALMALAVSRPEPRNASSIHLATQEVNRIETVVEPACQEPVTSVEAGCSEPARPAAAETLATAPEPVASVEPAAGAVADERMTMVGFTKDWSEEDNAPESESPAPSSSSSPALTPELAALKNKLHQTLSMYYPRHQNTRDNTPWEVMHAIIAYGVDTQLFKGGPSGETVNAVGWMCYNRPMGGEQMLLVNGGSVEARRGVGVQGHFGQFLAILAQSHVKLDYPMYVSGKSFTLRDLLEHEKAHCTAGEELTFKLIALMHYGDSDETWKSRDGQTWSIQRLVQEELKQPIRGAACGGTHRLTGLSYAVNKRIQRDQSVVGEFRRAQIFVQDYHRYTFSLQNPDGSFSTEWFTRRGDAPDVDRRLKTSGHILEWIAFSLSDEELRDPRMIKAVDYVSTILLQNDKHKWEIGPLGHGLHALSIYNSRVFKDPAVEKPPTIVSAAQGDAPVTLEARRVGEQAE